MSSFVVLRVFAKFASKGYAERVSKRSAVSVFLVFFILFLTSCVKSVHAQFQVSYCRPNVINTAIGCIPTDTSGFATFFLGYLLGIAGLVAFFLIIIAGFQILTSSGNPEKLEAAKQLLTSAFAGLLFIIFSAVILRVLEVNVFGGNLPGFPFLTH